MFRPLIASVVLMGLAVQAQAASQGDVTRLFDAMQVSKVIGIMRNEGMEYAETLAEEMLPDGSHRQWQQTVARIYDPEVMQDTLEQGFMQSVGGRDLEGAIAFFESDLGQRIVSLEIAAREALLDPAIEDASRETFTEMLEDGADRVVQVGAYIEVNDLIESNVVGALNANFAFLRGLSAGGAEMTGMSEGELLSSVWEQEEDVRAETRVWLYSYLLMAYAPLSDEDLDAYIEMSESDAGQALNSGLFAGFDPMYSAISEELGRQIGEISAAQEL